MTQPDGDAVFFPDIVVTESGELVELPVFSMANEHRVRQHLTLAFDRLPPETLAGVASARNFYTFATLRLLLTRSPGLLTTLGMLMYGQPIEWVRSYLTAAEIVGQVISKLAPQKAEAAAAEKPGPKTEGWTLARTIEFLTHEYKWTVEQVMEHSRQQIDVLVGACAARYEEQNKASNTEGGQQRQSRYDGHPRNSGVQPAARADVGEDGGLSTVRQFAARNNMNVKAG